MTRMDFIRRLSAILDKQPKAKPRPWPEDRRVYSYSDGGWPADWECKGHGAMVRTPQGTFVVPEDMQDATHAAYDETPPAF